MDDSLYGIWLPGKGWLKAKDDFFVESNIAKVREIAAKIGNGAQFRFIDSSPDVNLVLQELYLERERRTICHYFNNIFKPRIRLLLNRR